VAEVSKRAQQKPSFEAADERAGSVQCDLVINRHPNLLKALSAPWDS